MKLTVQHNNVWLSEKDTKVVDVQHQKHIGRTVRKARRSGHVTDTKLSRYPYQTNPQLNETEEKAGIIHILALHLFRPPRLSPPETKRPHRFFPCTTGGSLDLTWCGTSSLLPLRPEIMFCITGSCTTVAMTLFILR